MLLTCEALSDQGTPAYSVLTQQAWPILQRGIVWRKIEVILLPACLVNYFALPIYLCWGGREKFSLGAILFRLGAVCSTLFMGHLSLRNICCFVYSCSIFSCLIFWPV